MTDSTEIIREHYRQIGHRTATKRMERFYTEVDEKFPDLAPEQRDRLAQYLNSQYFSKIASRPRRKPLIARGLTA